MTPEKAIKLAHEIFSDAKGRSIGLRWYLFSNGTVVAGAGISESDAVAMMQNLAKVLGPYEGQASIYGDVNPMPLRAHEKTWLVGYPFSSAFLTFVDEDDLTPERVPPEDEVIQTPEGATRARDAVGDLRMGLCARAKRNQDARAPKVIGWWNDA